MLYTDFSGSSTQAELWTGCSSLLRLPGFVSVNSLFLLCNNCEWFPEAPAHFTLFCLPLKKPLCCNAASKYNMRLMCPDTHGCTQAWLNLFQKSHRAGAPLEWAEVLKASMLEGEKRRVNSVQCLKHLVSLVSSLRLAFLCNVSSIWMYWDCVEFWWESLKPQAWHICWKIFFQWKRTPVCI